MSQAGRISSFVRTFKSKILVKILTSRVNKILNKKAFRKGMKNI